jgi:hypothetical protein
MEIIEESIWVIAGFISTLLSMEVAWRLARMRVKETAITRPIPVELKVRA